LNSNMKNKKIIQIKFVKNEILNEIKVNPQSYFN